MTAGAAGGAGLRTPSIGIVGGGIGGLTLALACHEAGLVDLTVYEQSSASEALGAGVQLSPNATRVLTALGLKDALAAAAFYPQAIHLRTWRSGYLVANRPLGQFSEARYGAPYYNVHRGDLHALLLQAARARGIAVETGRRVGAAGADAAGPWLTFEGSAAGARHDAVIGCDGIHSVVRAHVLAAEEPAAAPQEGGPRFTGHVAWRGMVAAERLPKRLLSPTVTAWMGPRRHFVHYFVRGGELVNFVGVVESADWTEASWRSRGEVSELLDDFTGWHAGVRAIIEAADEVYKWALYDHPPLSTWSRGAVTLLGDACHPMLPYLAQGAAMAIEDAWVLSRMLERWEDEPAHGISDYERFRRPRTTRVQLRSRAQGDEFHLAGRWPVLARNLKLALGTRYLPEIAMQQFDWLHGYDCVRGFD